MLILLILDSLALLALVCSVVILARRKSGSSPGRFPVALPVSVAGLLLAASVALNAVVYLNAPGAATAASFGARTGLQARAQDWLAQRKEAPPKRDEVRRNMRIISEGMAFLRPYYPQLPPHLRLQLEDAALLPTRITSVLTVSEEQKYFEGAQAVFEAVTALAAQPATAV